MSKVFPAGTILELGPPHYDPNAPNIKHTMISPQDLRLNYWGTRPIISIGHASPAAEAAALAGAAEAARENRWIGQNHSGTIYNLESRQANEMQRRMQDQHGYTEFRGCKEGEFDLCVFENPRTGNVRAFKRPFIPIGAENPLLVASRELMLASHAPEIVRGRILHPGVLEQPPLMSRAMRDAMDADPNRTRRSGFAGFLSGQFVVPPPSRIYADKKKQLEQQKLVLKKHAPSSMGGKTRTGRARLRHRSRSRSRRR